MAPRKRSNVLTTETIQEHSMASKKKKQTKQNDSGDKNEINKKFEAKSVSDLQAERTSEFPSPKKGLQAPKSNQKRNPRKSVQNESKIEVEKKLEMPVDELNVAQLLALGEQLEGVSNSTKTDEFDDSSESNMSDFEEVKSADALEPIIPKEGVNITLEAPNLFNKHKKKGFDMEAHLKRQMIRVRKDLQLLMHKVHVLCWIAHLRFVNNTLNDSSLMEICASLIKSKNLYPSKYSDLDYLEGILKWFHKNIELKKDVNPLCTGGLFNELKYQLEKKQAFSNRTFTFIFIVLLRVLGLKARVVISFQVLPVRPSLQELYGDVLKTRSEKLKLKKSCDKPETNEEKKKNEKSKISCHNSEESAREKNNKRKSSDGQLTNQKKKGKTEKEEKSIPKLEVDNSDDEFDLNVSEHFKAVNKSGIKKKTKLKSAAGEPDDLKSKKGGRKSVVEKKKQIRSNIRNDDEDEDNDFTPVSLKKNTNKKRTERKSDVSGEESQEKKKEGSDVWTEVYLEAEEKWICVDVPRQKIHCVGEIYVRATHPVAYIVACNNDHTLKDVTKRYVPNWHSDTRKRRADEEWWNDTMKPYLPAHTAQDKEEDEDIKRQLMDKPLPSSISEFKDHPLYALKRHLLKFEAIYPPDAPTLGFVRGEPVYARECVQTLHSREMWYKQARLVRLKEEPYKIVKARPKYDKMTGEIKKDLPLELFGYWQTENYIPPIATDGKVPRNEYGNVDLFKPCMLPIGTVHLQIPALNRIAKKFDIDCAPATVGFDFHSGGSHPVFDGFVVCEEFKDILLDAWNKEIDESSKKEVEKREKRVYGNWRRLIRGLLIREKLKIKYAFGENSDDEGDSKPLTSKASTSKLSRNK